MLMSSSQHIHTNTCSFPVKCQAAIVHKASCVKNAIVMVTDS